MDILTMSNNRIEQIIDLNFNTYGQNFICLKDKKGYHIEFDESGLNDKMFISDELMNFYFDKLKVN